MSPSSRTHANLKNQIRIALGELDWIVVWNNESGVATHASGHMVRYGVGKGGSDLLGILAPRGRLFACEVKTGRATLSKEQKWFLELVNSKGGYACVARSVEKAVEHAERARAGHPGPRP